MQEQPSRRSYPPSPILRGLDEIIRLTRDTAREADARAGRRDPHAYSGLSELAKEYLSIVSTGRSAIVEQLDSRASDSISATARFSLARVEAGGLSSDLIRVIEACDNWRTEVDKERKRAPIVIVDKDARDDGIGEWADEMERLQQEAMSDPDFVTEQRSRENVESAIKVLLRTFDRIRSTIISVDVSDTDQGQAPEYSITKNPSGSYLVKYGAEIGEIKGKGADRFVRLCRAGDVSLTELAFDEGKLSELRSTAQNIAQELGESASGLGRRQLPIAELAAETHPKDLLAALNSKIEEISQQLSPPPCDHDGAQRLAIGVREELEEQHRIYKAYRRGIKKFLNGNDSDSDEAKLRDNVRTSLRRLADAKQSDMPKFAGHVRTCVAGERYQPTTRRFTYDNTDWEFQGFSD